jgi:hypothetical protein
LEREKRRVKEKKKKENSHELCGSSASASTSSESRLVCNRLGLTFTVSENRQYSRTPESERKGRSEGG